MRLDLFNDGDDVLILGEGNFSFVRSLFSHNLPIKITATCFDNGEKYSNQQENVHFLRQNNIPVLFNVDATSLHEHPQLKNQRYSKIIFNFPHVGGKMKIQLNRDLVKRVCASSSHILNDGGLMIVSLCNGQGGTPADNPRRKWSDSWQITEMAAHGSFCLISVEPFEFRNFESYTCTGYRSQDSRFNLNGALVHVFKKKLTQSRIIEEDVASRRLKCLTPVRNLRVSVPHYYHEMYSKNPLKNPNSAVSFMKKILRKCLENIERENKLKLIEYENLSVFLSSHVTCHSHLDSSLPLPGIISPETLEYFKYCTRDEIIFVPCTSLNLHLGRDFHKIPPIEFQFLLVGERVSAYFHEFVKELESLFREENLTPRGSVIFSETVEYTKNINSNYPDIHFLIENNRCESVVEWTSENDSENVLAHELHVLVGDSNLQIFIIYVDKIIQIFFKTESWKESWSDDNFVCLDSKSKPVLKHSLIYPLSYTFDITLQYDSVRGLADSDVYEVLRISAIDMIKNVQIIDEYDSGTGWSSKCFRITYECLNEALHRQKVVDIHTNLIGKMLALALNVIIS